MPSSPVVRYATTSGKDNASLRGLDDGLSEARNATNNEGDKSTQMRDAQKHFRRVVKTELDILLSNGMERERAVQCLLERIVDRKGEPSCDEVCCVMKQFRMNKEDAVRALIVKQELSRLKRRGLDPLAAIEELTLKMQGMAPMSQVLPPREAPARSNQFKDTQDDDNEGLDDGDEEMPHEETDSLCCTRASAVFDAVVSTRSNTSAVSGSTLRIIKPLASYRGDTAPSKNSRFDVSELLNSKLKRQRLIDADGDANSVLWNLPQRKKRRTTGLATLEESNRSKRRDRESAPFAESKKRRK